MTAGRRWPRLTPEFLGELEGVGARARALRGLLHAYPGPLTPKDLQLLTPAVGRDAAVHGLLATLAAARAPGADLSPEVEALVRQSGVSIAFQSQRVRRTYELSMDALGRAAVAAVPLKGRALALRLYGDATARFSGDVDLLVAEEDLDRALAGLAAAGFVGPPPRVLAAVRRRDHHVLLQSPGGLPPLELHFALASGIGESIATGQALARARVEEIAGRPTRVLSPEDEFVYLAAHAATHAFTPLSGLLDLKMLARRGLDRALAADRAREWKVEVALATALHLARHWTGLDWKPAASLRSALALPLFAGPLMLTAAHSRNRRWAAWLTTPALTDSPSAAGRRFAQQAARVLRRRARRHLPTVIPENWGD